ncbi:ParM/StbA family protein [Crocosphaera chwakensis]|uniref:Actin-like protein N-terminal domain-containing protein n=1 Tax=Crocosphaera chwakensis CCY0110 TaxID=391612 RepID=A3IX96_9CHRO|nr:ParM/StbA family protein [Crocosphaera chwakensis]EAZ88889.1 hypothetical protein CY0110_31855 [Crocosphaera chwakensis CCY0110]
MSDLTMALDFGSSLGRAIYTTSSSYVKPELLLLDPHVVEVPNISIANYEKYKVGNPSPQDSSWVNLNDTYFAVGFLAKRQFSTIHCLNSLKIDSAIPLTLAMVGAVAEIKGLGTTFSLDLGVLLPWSEFKDKDKLKSVLDSALQSFEYRGQQYHVTLQAFDALPEGGGLFARGRVASKGKPMKRVTETNLVVLMIGYRNASILVVERGELTIGLTSEFGFSQMITKIKTFTSGQSEDVLIPAICTGKSISDRTLERLARSQRAELREAEKKEIKDAIEDSQQEYVATLTNWISQQIPPHLEIDEILLGGGTAKYFKRNLTTLLKSYGAQINWSQSLEKRVVQTFGNEVSKNYLASRLADVYGLFYRLLKKPLPRLKEVVTRESA